ncbi:MAG: hypothetical protein ACRDDH_00045 [Cetobacterium sp.]|uniref:hypothetical protein n=1 Tax=Cetobacterium sp. TaxID=2071632 RepID=UPI003EE4CF89
MEDRLYVRNLYTNPVFKKKFWRDSEVYNENTPLLSKNISPILETYTKNFSKVYETLEDYIKNCKHKEWPQVVGLEGIDHWIAVELENHKYKFIDSSGCPKEAYYDRHEIPDLPPKNKVIATEEGFIRQSPLANSCGLYALFYCLGYYLEHNGYVYWINHAPKTISYEPVTIVNWVKAYTDPQTEYLLYSNDINLYNFYKSFDI